MKIILQSPLSVEKCAEKLRDSTSVLSAIGWRMLPSMRWAMTRRMVISQIGRDGFRLQQRRFWGSSVTCAGKWTVQNAGTRIEATLRVTWIYRLQEIWMRLSICAMLLSPFIVPFFIIKMSATAVPIGTGAAIGRATVAKAPTTQEIIAMIVLFEVMLCLMLISTWLPPMVRALHLSKLDADNEARLLQDFLIQNFGAQIIETQPQEKRFPFEITF